MRFGTLLMRRLEMSWAARLLKNLSAEDQDSITFTCLKSARQELSHAVGSAGKAPRLAARPATVTSSSVQRHDWHPARKGYGCL